MKIVKMLCPKNKWNIKCPYEMTPEFITVHNTANNASAMSEISYMIGNNNEVSYHVAVDDEEIVQGIEFNRNTWNAGDGSKGNGNRKSISIEICYSTGELEQFKNAEKLAAKYIAYLLKERNWGIDRVKKHQDWSGKYCPHKTLDLGWDRFINMVKAELNGTTPQPEPQPTPQPQPQKIDVKYQVYVNGWLSDVINYNDTANGYAGVYGKTITGLRANTVGDENIAGKLIYKVHTLNGEWLDEVVDREKDKNGDNYAGILGKAIDGIMIKCTKRIAKYRVHIINGSWLPWVSGYDVNDHINGYAGNLGHAIDGIQIEIV